MDNQPNLTDYLAIMGSEYVDAETKELAGKALKETLRLVPGLMSQVAEIIGKANE